MTHSRSRRASLEVYALAAIQAALFFVVASRVSRDMDPIDPLDGTSFALVVLTLVIGVGVVARLATSHRLERRWIVWLVVASFVMGTFLALSLPEEARLGPRFWALVQFIVLLPLTVLFFIASGDGRPRSTRVTATLRMAPLILHAATYAWAAAATLVLWQWIEVETQATYHETPGVPVILVVAAVVLLLHFARRDNH